MHFSPRFVFLDHSPSLIAACDPPFITLITLITMFRLLSLALLLWASPLSSSLFLPDSPELRRLLSRYEDELEANVTASTPGSRVRRAIPWSDREEILLLHNKLRGGVYPTASNMEYMVRNPRAGTVLLVPRLAS